MCCNNTTYSFCLYSRLLFTEESVLQHELGRGQLAFKWHKRSKQPAAAASSTATTSSSSTDKTQPASPKKDGEGIKDGSKDSSKDETETPASISSGEMEGERLLIFCIALFLACLQLFVRCIAVPMISKLHPNLAHPCTVPSKLITLSQYRI